MLMLNFTVERQLAGDRAESCSDGRVQHLSGLKQDAGGAAL